MSVAKGIYSNKISIRLLIVYTNSGTQHVH